MRYSIINQIISLLLLVFFIVHVLYLSLNRFDYGYNMKASITIALVNLLIWLTWSVLNQNTLAYARKMIKLSVIILFGSALEIFDFPPIFGIFDAHSLWHAATIYCAVLFWDFIKEDALFLIKMQ